MRIVIGGLAAIVLASMFSMHPQAAATPCEKLASLALPNTTITEAQLVQAGAFTPPGAAADGRAFATLPAFCRVAATLKPSSDSDIKIEVWLPAAGWNGKFQAVGNGAFNGTSPYPAMAAALARGYATSSTDTGHTGGSASWALGHPEKVVDFGWRAVHEMTVAAKKIIARHYDQRAEVLVLERLLRRRTPGDEGGAALPDDFDGIIAGAPGLDWTSRAARAVHVAKVLESNDAARLLQPHAQLLHRAVVDACDALDGVKDGLIENPQRCTFDPRRARVQGRRRTARA